MLVRTIIFYLLLSIWTIFLGILFLPFLFFPANYLKTPAKLWIKGIFLLLEYICEITHELRGKEYIPNDPVIIVSKHQSAFETFALFYYLNKSFFIHKNQLFYIPIFGQYLWKSNMVSIDRKGKSKTMRKMLYKVKKRFDDGSSIIIFPEGTRKKPGEVPDYKTGFVGIYREVNRKLLPVAVNSGLFWPKHKFIFNKGKIIIDILPTIEAGLSKNEVLNKVQDTIEKASKKLLT